MPKISQLETATDITASDLMQVVDIEDTGMAPTGTNKKATAQLVANELVKLVDDNSVSASKIEDYSITSVKIDSISNDLVNDAISEDAASTIATLGAVSTSQLSTTGGASKVFQANDSGNFITGPYANNGSTFSQPGNIHIPDQQGIRWLKKDGTLSGAAIRMWQDHDVSGGELIVDAPWRTAIIQPGPLQFGNNASLRDAMYLYMVSGAPTSTDTLRASKAIGLQTHTWTGGGALANQCAIQAVPLDTSGTNSVIRFYQNSTVVGSNGETVTPTTGNVTGSLLGEMHSLGIYTTGTAPVFDDLIDEATITQTCSKYKTTQAAKVTLGGNRVLKFSGALSGMRGIIYVKQDNVGGRTLTPINGSALDLSTTAGYIDKVFWEFDGLYFNFHVVKNISQQILVNDPDAAAFISASGISNGVQVIAIDTLVQGLKNESLWDRWHALYPFVGGTSGSNSVNLRSPGTYDISWVGGITHNSNGITSDGINGYGNTNLNLNSVLNVNSTSVYAYCRTQTVASGLYFCGATTSTTRLGMASTGSNLQSQGPNDNTAGAMVASAGSDFRKHLAINRSASNASQIYANSAAGSSTNASVSAPNGNMFICARNVSGSAANFAPVNLSFFGVGASLSSSEWSKFRDIINTFQTSLGRGN